MKKFLIVTLKWLYTKRRGIIEFLAYAIFFILLMKEHIYTASIVMFLISLKGVYPISKKLVKITKSAFVLKLYNIVIWFSSYIISLKILSFSIGISEDKLKYAPVIMAVPVSIIIIYILIAVISLLMLLSLQVMAHLSLFMTTKLKNKITNSEYYIFASRFHYLIFLLVPFSLATAYVSPYFIRLALLADSTFISDCGIKDRKKTYIRIDDKSCISFNLNWSVINKDPERIASLAEKQK
ncbi:hypothetical protein [Erwinia amylovora]|uniref:hypothetical protein n=1 Tax=Erwinia amylovora TaxID=552 RepID=UPI00144390EF|nr:hypothetical protein [Erwinia amylovora]